jgi:hypothetical protein
MRKAWLGFGKAKKAAKNTLEPVGQLRLKSIYEGTGLLW